MISSEVQRTLVKSPPELWAELSDPAALARHLGELGEIRIVRVEPECMVEWAAENTTGTVSIKPSGWGTNVRLTATRELIGPDPEPALEPTPEGAVERVPEVPVEPVPEAAVEPVPVEPVSEATVEPAPVPAVEPVPVAAVEPVSEATVEQVPAPAVEPVPVEAVEPMPEAAFESESVAADDREPVAVDQPERTTTTEELIEPKPRRGFFARLFARRRAPTETAPADSTAPTTEPPATTAARTAAQPPPERSSAAPDPFAAVREALAPESVATSHPFVALPPASPTTPPATDGPREGGGTGRAEPSTDANELATPTGGEAVARDISEELMAAEEVAAEQVTAVLAAVLDRLGAAHHRPFSRA